MFKINEFREIPITVPVIAANYAKLLGDDIPILITGTNKFGNKVLEVIVEESSDNFLTRYFHIVLTTKSYYDFINKKNTLRDILLTSDVVYVVDKRFEEIKRAYVMPPNEIPVDYLPLEDSYCPNAVFVPSFEYGISLQGKKSEEHLVEVFDANNIQSEFAVILKKTFEVVRDQLGLNAHAYLMPNTPGSFRVNYKIEIESAQQTLFKPDEKLMAKYLNSYLTYIVSALPNEGENILREEIISSIALQQVEQDLIKLLKSAHYGYEENKIRQELLNSINDSAQKFESITNHIKLSSSFDSIEIINYQKSGRETGYYSKRHTL